MNAYDLKELDKNIDKYPFTGIRIIEEGVKVKCRCRDIDEKHFYKTSMLGISRDEYRKRLAKWVLTPEKEYMATKIEGFGDVFDIYVINDEGKEMSYMSIFFKIM